MNDINNIWAHNTKGVLGLRQFEIPNFHYAREHKFPLTSIIIRSHDWKNGQAIAICAGNQGYSHLKFNYQSHNSPNEDCSCGLYSYLYLSSHVVHEGALKHFVIALIENTGKIIVGENGVIRAEKSRIIGFCKITNTYIPNDNQLNDTYFDEITNYYDLPIIPLEQAEETMLEHNLTNHKIERTDQWKPAKRSKLYESREILHDHTESNQSQSQLYQMMALNTFHTGLLDLTPAEKKKLEKLEEEKQKKFRPRVWITDRVGNQINLGTINQIRFSHGFDLAKKYKRPPIKPYPGPPTKGFLK